MKNRDQITGLLEKYQQNRCSPEEVRTLLHHFKKDNIEQDELMELVNQQLQSDISESDLNNPQIETAVQNAHRHIHEVIRENNERPNYFLWKQLSAAAFLIVVGSLFYVITRKQNPTLKPAELSQMLNVAPGGNKAFLTLANGKRISLSEVQNGRITSEAGVEVIKSADGQIKYASNSLSQSSNFNNTIETPKGGQYQVRLPDGTEVWLNAASKLTYPVSSTGRGQRVVELSGEAYFQVAKDKAHPFIVKSAGQQVQVLGTHFNVNSYIDEGRTVTTLEEGSIKLVTNTNDQTIKPGEQAIVTNTGKMKVESADMQTALAWKNGLIRFKDADAQTVLREIGRWYNLQIKYIGAIPQGEFTGTISRTSNLKTVLKIFDMIDINFRLEEDKNGKILVVTH